MSTLQPMTSEELNEKIIALKIRIARLRQQAGEPQQELETYERIRDRQNQVIDRVAIGSKR